MLYYWVLLLCITCKLLLVFGAASEGRGGHYNIYVLYSYQLPQLPAYQDYLYTIYSVIQLLQCTSKGVYMFQQAELI